VGISYPFARLPPLLVILAACGPTFWGQDDGFRAKIANGCGTEEACEELKIDARRRVASCQPNAIGYVRCEDASADLQQIDEQLQQFTQRRQDREVARRRAELQATELAAARQRWLAHAVERCDTSSNTDPCNTATEGIDEDTRVECFSQCQAKFDALRQTWYERGFSDCVTRLVDSSGSEPPDCRFQHTDAQLEARRVECAASCKEEASKLFALEPTPAASPAAADPPPPAPAVRVQAAPAKAWSPVGSTKGDGTALLCCDGTLSPTCACPGHQGCCSHHHGVCGCQ
jgi:hypothetical protein